MTSTQKIICISILSVLIFSGVFAIRPLKAEEYLKVTEPVITDVEIEINGHEEIATPLKNTAKNLIDFLEGQPLSPEMLQNAISILKQSRLFQTITVEDPASDMAVTSLKFRLTPYTRIKDIKIEGGFPLLERNILNAMTVYIGDIYEPEKLKRQKERIEKLYTEDGYIDPEVTITSEQDSTDMNHIIKITIDKGDFYVIRQFQFSGNENISSSRLHFRFETWKKFLYGTEIQRFVRTKIDVQIKSVTQLYRQKGYADIVIKPEIQINPKTNEVKIHLIINEGPLYKIAFQGNDYFWDWQLKQNLTLKKYGNLNDFSLKKSIRSIQDRYKKAGYADVKISIKEPSADTDTHCRNIRVVINEGMRHIVQAIVISGNRSMDTNLMEKQILTQAKSLFTSGAFVKNVLEEDKLSIETLYLKKGYRNSLVASKVNWQDDKKKNLRSGTVFLSIEEEGEQTLVNEILFDGFHGLSKNEIQSTLLLKEGEPFCVETMKEDEAGIAALISEKGYPHAVVTGTFKTSANEKKATVTFLANEGKFVLMGNVFCTGNFRTKERIILNEVDNDPGTPFSLMKMLKTQQNIRNINSLHSADFQLSGFNEKTRRVNLIVAAEEKKPYYFQIGAGYDTKRKAYGNIKVGDLNLFGLNKEISIASEYSQIGHREELSLNEPRFIGTRVSSTLKLFNEKREDFNMDYGTRNYGASLLFSRKFLDRMRTSISFRYDNRHKYQTDPESVVSPDDEQYDPRNLLTITPSILYHSTDSFVSPTKGIYTSVSTDISRGLKNDIDNFYRYRLELRYFYSPLTDITFAVRGKAGLLVPYTSNIQISEDQLFFLGGTSDVRGFDENMLRYDSMNNSVGGRRSVSGTLEIRYTLWSTLELTTFFDSGNISKTYDTSSSNGFRSSAGVGLRYITPIGPVGFVGGMKINPRENESKGKIHFTIGHSF